MLVSTVHDPLLCFVVPIHQFEYFLFSMWSYDFIYFLHYHKLRIRNALHSVFYIPMYCGNDFTWFSSIWADPDK